MKRSSAGVAFLLALSSTARAQPVITQELKGWTHHGSAFAQQPICGPWSTARWIGSGGLPVARLGGDYWIHPIDLGFPPSCRLDSQGRSRDGGSIESPPFRTSRKYLSLIVGGGGLPGTRVELRVESGDGSAAVIASHHGPGRLSPLRVVWDLSAKKTQPGSTLRVAVVDESESATLKVQKDLAALTAAIKDCKAHAVVADCAAEYSRKRDARIAQAEAATGGLSAITVQDIEFVDEPPAALQASRDPLWGFADYHAHLMAQHAFGGTLLHGAVDDEGASGGDPLSAALPLCKPFDHGNRDLRSTAVLSMIEPPIATVLVHGARGQRQFDHWPRFGTIAHQQAYVDWLKRAWRGGLRLVVAPAVNNELLAEVFDKHPGRDDLHAVRTQLEKLTSFVSRHSDFMEIATGADHAARIIALGRLAIVPGAEVDSFAGCGRGKTCTEEQVVEEVERLHGLGLRHVFPIHLADNEFGGTAIFDQRFNMLNYFLNHRFYEVDEQAPASIFFRLQFGAGDDFLSRLVGAPVSPSIRNAAARQYASVSGGHRNARGLTQLGRFLVRTLLRKGMMVDVDHMSERSAEETLQIARELNAPLVSGHTGLRELQHATDCPTAEDERCASIPEKWASEANKSTEQLNALREVGGVVGLITHQGDVRAVRGSGLADDCAGSSKSWAQAYAYLSARLPAVALGTDFNGLAGQPLPRFGPFACLLRKSGDGDGPPDPLRARPGLGMAESLRRDADAQTAGVSYAPDDPLTGYRSARFWPRGGDQPYDSYEAGVFEALAIARSGIGPHVAYDQMPSLFLRTALQAAEIHDLAEGFASPVPLPLAGPPERGVASLLVHGLKLPSDAADATRATYARVERVFTRWREMEKGGNASAPLQRSWAGERDFDYNLDGLAQIGLLPDFLQDVGNQLREARSQSSIDLRPVFASAAAYVSAWKRVEETAAH